MGNRAVVAMEVEGIPREHSPAIYLHWNGGRDSVEAFLESARRLDVRTDEQYSMARLVQIIGNYIGGTLSVGLGTVSTTDADNGDNGLYWISPDLRITDREYTRGPEQNNHDLEGMVTDILEANPQFNDKT